jgi:hypothetical protein
MSQAVQSDETGGGADFWLPTSFVFCNLAGKDAGQNSTKLLRGLNAEC